MRTAYILIALLVMSGSAAAGDCPVCDGPEDCPGGFCVLHDSEVGCGAELQLCCPGQACSLNGEGRPSCEAAGTCVVVGEGAPDAGAIDAAPGAIDAAPGAIDAAPGFDAGGDTSSDDGCGCRVGAAAGRGGETAAGALLLFALLVTRRRRK